MKLIILGCCATKRADPAPLKAIDRYDGPMWSTLRARLAALPAARDALASGELQIWVLSALYGFVSAETEIPDYDRRMTPDLALKMARDPSYDFQRIGPMAAEADAVLFAGGGTYRDAMRRAAAGGLSPLAKITETDAAGIGLHRAQLGDWLAKHFPTPALAKAA